MKQLLFNVNALYLKGKIKFVYVNKPNTGKPDSVTSAKFVLTREINFWRQRFRWDCEIEVVFSVGSLGLREQPYKFPGVIWRRAKLYQPLSIGAVDGCNGGQHSVLMTTHPHFHPPPCDAYHLSRPSGPQNIRLCSDQRRCSQWSAMGRGGSLHSTNLVNCGTVCCIMFWPEKQTIHVFKSSGSIQTMQ